MTRDTVPRPTPARAATWSSVGRSREAVTGSVSRPGTLELTVSADPVGVPPAARLHRAGLGGVVDVHDAEALPVAMGPLEVVQQGPDEVPPQRHSRGECRRAAVDVSSQVGGSFLVVDLAIRGRLVV